MKLRGGGMSHYIYQRETDSFINVKIFRNRPLALLR